MTNDNCLEGLRCPRCGNEGRLLITASIVAEVTDDGADAAPPQYGNGFEWNDESHCRCPECDRHGALKAFRVPVLPPPDPDCMNVKRASWAALALNAFMITTDCDQVDALADLLCDLMHWCDCNSMSFLTQMERAQRNYDAETVGDAA